MWLELVIKFAKQQSESSKSMQDAKNHPLAHNTYFSVPSSTCW